MMLDGLLEKVAEDEIADYYVTGKSIEEFKSFMKENNYRLVGERVEDSDCYPFLSKDYYMFSIIGAIEGRRAVVEGVDFIATI